jgi:hypothetical protein
MNFMNRRKQLNDDFGLSSISDAILPSYRCDHTKAGTPMAVELQRDNETVGVCESCYEKICAGGRLDLTLQGNVLITMVE